MTVRCNKGGCKNTAIIHQKYAGLHLCEPHFVDAVEGKAKKEMRKQSMIERGDKIAVALSGGKDSSALLYMLKKIFHNRNDLQVFALAVDEGISGFRALTLNNAKKIAKELEIELCICTFADEFGFTQDEIASKGFEQAPCTFCGVLRRKLIDKKARELGATKVATAHNLDDEVQSIMINYVRGDIGRLKRVGGRRKEFIPRIKPLRTVLEKEVALYALTAGIPLSTVHCPYAELSFRFTVKRMLNEFEMRHPGTKYALMRGNERFLRLLPAVQSDKPLLRCELCGEASASGICKACEIVERLKAT